MRKQKMDWISVEDELPPFGPASKVIFFNGKKEVTFGYAYLPNEGWDTGSKKSIWINDMDRETNEIATHWMPIPPPPNDNEILEIVPPNSPYSVDDKMFYSTDPETGESLGPPYSLNDFYDEIEKMSGINEDLLGKKHEN